MRLALVLLLAVLIPINAAFAAVTAMQHALQPDHHVHVPSYDHKHDHEDDHEQHSAQADHAFNNDAEQQTSGADPTSPECNHHHAHVHPVFSLMLPTPVGLHLPITTGAPPTLVAETYISAIPSRLERPPRFAPVA